MVPSLASGSAACVCECCVHLHCHHIYQTFYLVEKHSDLDLFIQFIQWNFQKHGPYDQNSWQCMIMSATYVSADLKTVEMLYLFTLQLSISWGFNLQSCVLMTLCSWSAFFLGPKTTLVRRLCLSLVLLLQKKKKRLRVCLNISSKRSSFCCHKHSWMSPCFCSCFSFPPVFYKGPQWQNLLFPTENTAVEHLVSSQLWSICDITLQHRVTHLYPNLVDGLARKNWFSTAALMLLAVQVQVCISWPIRRDQLKSCFEHWFYSGNWAASHASCLCACAVFMKARCCFDRII